MTRVFMVAGEASGDIHGANLAAALARLEPGIQCEGLGGARMAVVGVDLRCDLASRAIMGFVEVIRSLAFIRRLYNETLAHWRVYPPDCLVLVDYPGLNMRLAAAAHAMGIPVVYYISPQVWAWKRKRIHTLARTVDKMLVILPFEKPLYDAAGLDCEYVGHPLVDHVAEVSHGTDPDEACLIGLLPGSREQEIRRILGVMLDTAKGIQEAHPEARFVVPCVDTAREAQIRAMLASHPGADALNVSASTGSTSDVLARARFCLVASGTATLEATLHDTPMVILYKVNPLTYCIARTLVSIEHIGLVNIIAGKRVVPELIQENAIPELALAAALPLIDDTPVRVEMLSELARVRAALGGPGASQRAAEAVLSIARRGATMKDATHA